MRQSSTSLFVCSSLAATLLLTLSGCALGPAYQRPEIAVPAVFKETPDWVIAQPADAVERGDWWRQFNDADLNALMERVTLSNQNVAAASAAYAQARAAVREQRAALFPVVSLDGGGRRSGGGSGNSNSGASTGNSFQASIGATWGPEVWGRLQSGIDGASAAAEASAADLASALLAARGELAVDYLSLRQSDLQRNLLQATVAGYRRSLQIAQNRYQAGIVSKSDMLQAQTQLANAAAEEAGLGRQRAQFEHAIALLTGQAAGNFSLPPSPDWLATVPLFPVAVPSTLLQRRPDIAAAERRVAVANQQIGVARAAFYPRLNLAASDGSSARRVAELFSAGTSLWSLGLTAAQVVFNAGATRARVDTAEAAQQQAAARYRQTVLAAFAGVEDQLAASRVLLQQQGLREQASLAADEAEVLALNRYRAGQTGYTEVVTAQSSALAARRALVQVRTDRQITAVALIQALGGSWNSNAN